MEQISPSDVHAIETDTSSHVRRLVEAIITSAESRKKQKYVEAAEAHRVSFTPYMLSVDGGLGKEAESLYDKVLCLKHTKKEGN